MRSAKRTLEEIIAHEDSDDDDYDDRAPGPSKSRSSRAKQNRAPVRKKPRRRYSGSDIESDGEDLDSEEDSFQEDSDEDEIETNERGRPVRKTAKKAVKYEEEETDEEEIAKSSSEEPRTPPPTTQRKKLIIKLKTTPAASRPTRSTRTRSGSYAPKQGLTSPSTAQPTGTRRSSRLSHDEDEPVVALTNSGNHVEVIRAGSRDPEDTLPRAIKGGKGLKYPSKSTIDEEPESIPQEEDGEEEEGEGELEIKPPEESVGHYLVPDDRCRSVHVGKL